MADKSSDDELSPYILKDLKGLDPTTNQAKGAGCYGSVYQVTVDGLPCIAKRLHDILTGYGGYDSVSPEDTDAIRRSFRDECVLLCKLRHPNIVQFIGVHYGTSQHDLILVMEGLYMDLSTCLKKHPRATIPIDMKLSILLDVSYGLLYLHSHKPPIIHRDLTATNVLVTRDMKAKLADLGVSKILNLRPLDQVALTVCPGTLGVMPPEALVQEPRYDTKLDVFSFGCLALHTVNHEFPLPSSFGVKPNDQFKRGEKEIAKRKASVDRIGRDHCLHPLVLRCLQDDPKRRPDMAEVSRKLSEMMSKQTPTHYDDVLYMFEEIKKINKKKDLLEREQQAGMEAKSAHQDAVKIAVADAESLKKALKQKEDEYTKLQAELNLVRKKNSELTAENQQLIGQIKKLGSLGEDCEKLVVLMKENGRLKGELEEDLSHEEKKETREELRDKIQQLKDENTELKKRKESARKAVEYLEQNLKSTMAEKRKYEALVESTKEQSVECETTKQENGPVENEQLTVMQLKQKIASLRSQIDVLTEKNEELQAQRQQTEQPNIL